MARYHYFDSDMLGYNPVGSGPLKQRPVASVRQIEQDGNIILSKLAGPKQSGPIEGGLSVVSRRCARECDPGISPHCSLQRRTTGFFRSPRYAEGHTMDYTLRPGERIIRYFHPADDQKYFLPWAYDGPGWREFPQEIEAYKIKTRNGPRSQKDSRAWGTGRIEYRPPRLSNTNVVVDMPCPYVIIGAEFTMDVDLGVNGSLAVETSTDLGRTWTRSARLTGPYQGRWRAEPAIVAKSAKGVLNAVSGSYGYQVRFTSSQAAVTNLLLSTDFQLNPRSLPAVTPGEK